MAGQEPESTIPHPRNGPRRPSRAVYRRRRLVAAVFAVLLILVLVAAGFAIAGMLASGGNARAATGDSTTTPGPAGAVDPSATSPDEHSTSPSSTPADPTETPDSSVREVECDESKIVLESSTDSAVYPAGKNPVLTLTVRNQGEAPCAVNVGTSEMEFVLTHGEERVFSSADCQAGAENLVKVIDAGESEQAKFTWERNETKPGCPAMTSTPEPGAYVLTTRLGERAGTEALFELE